MVEVRRQVQELLRDIEHSGPGPVFVFTGHRNLINLGVIHNREGVMLPESLRTDDPPQKSPHGG